MDHIVLAGVKPYDGRYPFDLGVEFTTREWGWIKKHAGYLPATLNDDSFSDPELVTVLAIIVLHRAKRIEPNEVPDVVEKFADAPFGSTVTIEAGEPEESGEDDAGPPPVSSSSSNGVSGDSSPTSSETSPPSLSASGTTGSDTSRSDQTMSVT